MIVYRELASLEQDLGVSAKQLYSLSNDLEKHYHRVDIPKKNGKKRRLFVPDALLKSVQRNIVSALLASCRVSSFATAYKDGASVYKNAIPHIGKKKVLKLDIQKFFDNILYSSVKERVFPKERFSEQNRVLLTMLCYFRDVLPQGAPTSPMITNIIMYDFDETVGSWCRERKIDYTRYCDDMTFSGDFDARAVIAYVSAELRGMGFFLNFSKTRVLLNNQRQTVTGIVVNEKINTPSEYRKKLRQEVFYCKKYGVESHLERIGCDDKPEHYLQKLLGRISFALQSSPDNIGLQKDKETVLKLFEITV